MATTAKPFLPILVRAALDDLKPFDGRFGMAWRVAAQCALAALVFMIYGIPLVAIGCYLILFLMKPDGAESLIMAVGVAVLVSLAVVLLVFLARWTINDPVWQMLTIMVGSFVFIFIGAASPLGPIGNILGLVVGFVMTLLGDVPFGEVATRAILYAWLMAATPMGIIIVFNIVLGRSAPALLREGLAMRLSVCAEALERDEPSDELARLLGEGNEEVGKRAMLVKLLHLASFAEIRFLKQAVNDTYCLMLAVAGMDASVPREIRQALAHECRQAADRLRQRQVPGQDENELPEVSLPETDPSPAVMLAIRALRALAGGAPLPEQVTKSSGFFFADALSNPQYSRFAIKTTAAATLCYIVYTAIDWQGIHTAMITCYVAALGTTAETVHKLTLRIVGCLIGAALGVASILYLMPHMTGIGELMVLVFVGILLAGWVSAGSERTSYAGIQIGLAFLLTILQGFGPTFDLSTAWDRIVGILLGNVVMYVIFTSIWPESVAEAVREKVGKALGILEHCLKQPETMAHTEQLSQAMSALAQARESLGLARFEPRGIRPDEAAREQLKALIAASRALTPRVAVGVASGTVESTWSAEIEKMQQQLKKGEDL